MPNATIATKCVPGAAGMMLGYLLARAGVDVAMLEKPADFFRDFRGDTIIESALTELPCTAMATTSAPTDIAI